MSILVSFYYFYIYFINIDSA